MGERRRRLAAIAGLSEQDLSTISGDEGLDAERANLMVENALGVMGLPLALCANLQVDGREVPVPMSVEEASVVAAASYAAKLLRAGGGIRTEVGPAHMIGQIQVLDVPDPAAAETAILAAREELLAAARACDACLASHGGGPVEVEVRHLPPRGEGDPLGPMLVLHLVVDVRDAMGANTVNTMCERLAPRVEQLTGGKVLLKIISNLADRRTVVAEGEVPLEALRRPDGPAPEVLARGIEAASVFAERDPYRAATHNKGIMNGVDAVLLAFCQDWRAVEAGAHAFAAADGHYGALSTWRVEGEVLRGRLELPMPVGVVGGVTQVHPTAQVSKKLSGVQTAADLSRLAAAVGLAQNLGALRALAAEGIQRGHMRVHARNLAVASGASEHEVNEVARAVADGGEVSHAAAVRAVNTLRSGRGEAWTPTSVRERFTALREVHLPQINAAVEAVLDEAGVGGSSVAAMCRYHMGTGGKRLRAVLPLLVGEALGADPTRLVPLGAACEVLHNATLVHDDLQDGDRLRRGEETVWHRFGPAEAINLGDAMFYLTLLLVGRLDTPVARRQAITRRVLLETLRVIDGQQRELELARSDRPTLEAYAAAVEGKTSGLFALPVAGAAALCAAPAELVTGLEEAARHLGVLFQIQDDLLDLFGDKGRRQRGGDLREGKPSVLVVHALGNAPEADRAWLLRMLRRGAPDEQRTDGQRADEQRTAERAVERAVELFERAGSVQYAVEELARRREQALAVPALADHPRLRSMIAAMCELFLEPIRPFLDEREADDASRPGPL
jgi:hydroxymethylglutaryl-CoA reductase